MPLFEYKAANPLGKKISGIIEAAHLDEAKIKLRTSQICFISLKPYAKKGLLKFSQKQPKLSGQSLVTFTEQLAQLLGAGIPLFESLLSLEEELREEPFHPILLSLCEQVKSGSLLSQAMGHFPNSFPPLYRAILRAGEAVGRLDAALFKIAKLLAKQRKMQKQILAALAYPILLGGFSLIIIAVLLNFVVPSIEAIFAGNSVNRFTQMIIGLSHFVKDHWGVSLFTIVLLTIGSRIFFKTAYGNEVYWKALFKMPFVKTLLVQSALSRFSRTLASLLEGGVSLVDGLNIASDVMKNPPLEKIIEKAKERVIEGSSLSAELKKQPLIPPLFVRSLAVGEESGDTKKMLDSVATLYEEELERNLTKLTSLAQPVILLVLGGIVGLIMLAVLLPLTDMTAFLGG